MTFASLDIALSGLRINRQGIDVLSNNVANAQTEGYTRKILPQEAVVAGNKGIGVHSLEVERFVDEFLMRDFRTQLASTSYLDTRVDYLDRIQTFLGASETETAISAELNNLEDLFNQLASTPENNFLLLTTVDQADRFAQQVNGYADLLSQLRNDTQNDVVATVERINAALQEISDLNREIVSLTGQGRSTAALDDQIDAAVERLAKEIDITYFKKGDGTLVVQTNQGRVLADIDARTLYTQEAYLSPDAYYPATIDGILIEDPDDGVDLTPLSPGGRLGALLELRDETIPQYTAQLDEFAKETALRFATQGLDLFTDNTGNLPSDIPGNYVGFSSRFQVNEDVVADATLLRSGTNGLVVDEGSSELIRKIIDFAFGVYEREDAIGSVDLLAAPDVFTATGMTPVAEAIGDIDLTPYNSPAQLDDIISIDPGDEFTIQIGALPAETVTINAGDTTSDLLAQINGLAAPVTATLNSDGQILLEAPADITIGDGVIPNDLGVGGVEALGLEFTTYAAQDPEFTIQIGTEAEASITVTAADTAATLVSRINAAFPFGRVNAYLDANNFLVIEPVHGGEITIIDGIGTPAAAMGLTVTPIAHNAFEETGLGPDGNAGTDIRNIRTLEEYARAIVSAQSNDHMLAKERLTLEQDFENTLRRRVQDTSGVDIDQEISRLIELQTAFAASARVVTAAQTMLDELLAAV